MDLKKFALKSSDVCLSSKSMNVWGTDVICFF